MITGNGSLFKWWNSKKILIFYVDKYGRYCWYTNTTAFSPHVPLASVLLFNTNELFLYRNLNLFFHAYRFSWYKKYCPKFIQMRKMIVLCNSLIWINNTVVQLVLWIYCSNDLPSPVPPPTLQTYCHIIYLQVTLALAQGRMQIKVMGECYS